ncbi:MAG: heme NO-binding domain-containing protein [Pseudomonadota bacterium]
MYGLVNQGIETFITEKFGAETWDKIKEEAGIPVEHFTAILTYDDAITYDLVGAISRVLDVDPNEALKLFGEYWPSFAKETAIGRLFDFSGSSFVEFLESLDDMHDRMIMSLPDLRPPSFEVEHLSDGRYLLHYRSEREGLAPMVIGLLHGLAADFGVMISVDHSAVKGSGHEHDQFTIELASENQESIKAA